MIPHPKEPAELVFRSAVVVGSLLAAGILIIA